MFSLAFANLAENNSKTIMLCYVLSKGRIIYLKLMFLKNILTPERWG